MPSKSTVGSPNDSALVAKATKPLAAFTRLSPTVAYYDPPSTLMTSAHDNATPTTILLCSWMNARPKNVDYYARSYMAHYPSARIIHVSINTTQFIFQSEARRRKDMMKAVSTLLARGQESERLLVHSVSNGGGKRVYNIAAAYRSVTGQPLPAQALIFDSAPGIPRFKRDVHAIMVPARKLHWLPWFFALIATYVTVSITFVSVYWTPLWYELVWGPTYGCNDVTLVDQNSVRGYVYSKEDLAIDWRDVETHAEVAEEKGYKVVKKLVHDAQHAQLFKGRGGEEDYWGFIKGIWAMAMD
ncbi:hypothetical protein BDZ45DRAFT_671211 [Acephala macrosclerotiorum]|nr:hypothetical protein BDZ45DRAFT_671211 [Acephala macrosclerotiorum]